MEDASFLEDSNEKYAYYILLPLYCFLLFIFKISDTRESQKQRAEVEEIPALDFRGGSLVTIGAIHNTQRIDYLSTYITPDTLCQPLGRDLH